MQYFPHALSNLQGIAMNSDWFIMQFAPLVIGRSYDLYTRYWFLDGYLKTALSPNGNEHIATMKFNIIAFLQH